MVEPEPGAAAVPRIVRGANRKTVVEISDEIRSFQGQPQVETRGSDLTAIATRAPRFVRLGFFRLLKWNPHWFKRLSGTVIVTSVGMFGRGGGWGLGFLPLHTLGVLVGGIASKPAVHEGEIVIREFLNLTVSFDHDIVDGAPAARFVRSLADLVEGASALEEAYLSLGAAEAEQAPFDKLRVPAERPGLEPHASTSSACSKYP